MIFDFIANIISPVTKLIDTIDTSDEERLKFRNELAKIQKDVKLKTLDLEKTIIDKQAGIQQAEISKDDKFISRARPSAVYLLLLVIGVNYFVAPFVKYFYSIEIPKIEESVIYTLGAISGTFSLGRTMEKMKRMK